MTTQDARASTPTRRFVRTYYDRGHHDKKERRLDFEDKGGESAPWRPHCAGHVFCRDVCKIREPRWTVSLVRGRNACEASELPCGGERGRETVHIYVSARTGKDVPLSMALVFTLSKRIGSYTFICVSVSRYRIQE